MVVPEHRCEYCMPLILHDLLSLRKLSIFCVRLDIGNLCSEKGDFAALGRYATLIVAIRTMDVITR